MKWMNWGWSQLLEAPQDVVDEAIDMINEHVEQQEDN